MKSSAASSAGSGLVGMGLNLIGGLFNKGMSQEEAMRMQYENEIKKMQEQYNLNREMAKYSQELNKEMWEYTNYENQVKELEKAGLNPALLYGKGGGSGASTQGGGVKNSQHLTGNAIDFILKNKAKMHDAIDYIQENLEFDQLIHEHKHGAEWLHVSLVKEGNRKEFLEIWN